MEQVCLCYDDVNIFSDLFWDTVSANHFLTMTDACGMLSNIYGGPRVDLSASILFYIPLVREVSFLRVLTE